MGRKPVHQQQLARYMQGVEGGCERPGSCTQKAGCPRGRWASGRARSRHMPMGRRWEERGVAEQPGAGPGPCGGTGETAAAAVHWWSRPEKSCGGHRSTAPALADGQGAAHEAARRRWRSGDLSPGSGHVGRVPRDVVVAAEEGADVWAAGLQPVEQVHGSEREVEEGVREGPLQHVAVLARLQRRQLRQLLCALRVLGCGVPSRKSGARPPRRSCAPAPTCGGELAPLEIDGADFTASSRKGRGCPALGRRVPEQREVATVAVPQEVLDARRQLLEEVCRGVR